MKILDCTLRDGGYYTNWDFNKTLVDNYIEAMNHLPVDYLEVGYRSIPLKGYYGKYFYCPVYELEDLKAHSNKKLVVCINEKDIKPEHLDAVLSPIKGLVDMVRVVVDPQNLDRAIVLAEGIKKFGFEVGFNIMYMSKWNQYGDFIKNLRNIDGIADYFYMVDSYGGVYPKDIIETLDMVKSNTSCPVGFHGHNNLELALVNTLTALEHGAEIVDATILGMGRGAGNLKTELLLTVLNSKFGYDVNFNALGDVVGGFEGLLEKHQWGTNLPYMISGSNSLPQKDVMDWVTTRFYSLNSIIRALENQKNKVADNQSLPVFEAEHFTNVVIVGGGGNAQEHADGINEFVKNTEDVVLIHASSKNAALYKDLNVPQLFCLVGSEGHRLEKVFSDLGNFSGKCVLPPYPRKMGTYIPQSVASEAYELPAVEFTDQYKDSHTALALQTALLLNAKNIYVAGYDGYQEGVITQKERDLTAENEFLFSLFKVHSPEISLVSITPTNYKKLSTISLYENL